MPMDNAFESRLAGRDTVVSFIEISEMKEAVAVGDGSLMSAPLQSGRRERIKDPPGESLFGPQPTQASWRIEAGQWPIPTWKP